MRGVGRASRAIDACERRGEVDAVLVRVAVLEGGTEWGACGDGVGHHDTVQGLGGCDKGCGERGVGADGAHLEESGYITGLSYVQKVRSMCANVQ